MDKEIIDTTIRKDSVKDTTNTSRRKKSSANVITQTKEISSQQDETKQDPSENLIVPEGLIKSLPNKFRELPPELSCLPSDLQKLLVGRPDVSIRGPRDKVIRIIHLTLPDG